MKAIICREYGPIGNLDFGEMPDPVPGPHEVVIEAEAIGVNYPDGLLVQGLYQARPPVPFVPGMEVAGRIVATHDTVTRFRPGDRVMGLGLLGGYAEKVVVHAGKVFPIPEGADAGEAVALLCGYGTAHHALKQRAALKPGETLAVTGASGLTGLAAVQIGKAMGARVIAIASSPDKQRIALDHGASHAFGYDNLRDGLRDTTDGNGPDVVFDVVGGDVFDACSRSMAWNGRLLIVGFASGTIPKLPANLPLVKGYSAVGVFWGSFTEREPDAFAANMEELTRWWQEEKIRPYVQASYPLEDAASALEHIHGRKASGKIILNPRAKS